MSVAVGSLELIRPRTCLGFHPAGCPHTLFALVTPVGGADLVADNSSTMRQVVLVYMVPVVDSRV